MGNVMSNGQVMSVALWVRTRGCGCGTCDSRVMIELLIYGHWFERFWQ